MWKKRLGPRSNCAPFQTWLWSPIQFIAARLSLLLTMLHHYSLSNLHSPSRGRPEHFLYTRSLSLCLNQQWRWRRWETLSWGILEWPWQLRRRRLRFPLDSSSLGAVSPTRSRDPSSTKARSRIASSLSSRIFRRSILLRYESSFNIFSYLDLGF